MGQLDLGLVTDANKAAKGDLTSINATGSTNATGAAIASGIFFYLDGTLVKAKTEIAINATFTEGTNYEVVTAGGLNDLKSAIVPYAINKIGFGSTYTTTIHVKNPGEARLTILVVKGHQSNTGSIEILPIYAGFDGDITINSGSDAWTAPLIIYDAERLTIT